VVLVWLSAITAAVSALVRFMRRAGQYPEAP
jgi:hypothetical protein